MGAEGVSSWRVLWDATAVLAGVALVVTLVAAWLPAAAVLACVGLAAVSGGLAWMWAWLVSTRPWSGLLYYAVRAGVLGGAFALALAGFAMLFGPASVSVIVALYLVAAMLVWMAKAPLGRPCDPTA
ncbi:hypothetical protein [Pseudonocardia sp.]|uniref:hypothetical protein n=1 Tax=Pseudonocardia sp. TaxID=60912 RepID=UPI002F3F4FCC